jgi:carboxylesterase type B
MSKLKPNPQTFTHPLLGPFTGLNSPGTPQTTQFRSIPFASIPTRFRQSTLLTAIPSSHNRNFTPYGTACPSPPQLDQIEASGGLLPGEIEKKLDEESYLNLTISVPRNALSDEGRGERLPVMVYVHGGGFTVGSAHVSALHGESCFTNHYRYFET